MDLRSGYPYWLLKNGFLFSYPSLSENFNTDVLIIGAGVSGAIAGYYLAKSGVNVTIVDKRHPGMGSTCASTSLVLYEIDTHLIDLAKKTGYENARAAYLTCVDAVHGLQRLSNKLPVKSDFEIKRSLYLSSNKNDLKTLEAEYKARSNIGIKLDFLNGNDIQSLFGFKSFGGLLSYDAGQFDVYRFTHGLLQEVIHSGGKVYGQTEISRTKTEKRGMSFVTSGKNKIKARKCIFANGYESFQYISPPLTSLHSTYATISEPLEHIPVDYLLWETSRPYFYLRATPDKRIEIGGKDENFYNPQKRDTLLQAKSKALVKEFHKKFPAIPFKIDYQWSGTFAETKDGLPFIGVHPKYPHAYFALGFGGNGITFSLIAAEIISDLFFQRKNRNGEIFSFRRIK